MKSRWTILVIPENNQGMKKTTISMPLISACLCLILGLFIFSGVAGYRLYSLRADLARVSSIKDVNKDQKKQLALLTEKVVTLDSEMNELRSYNIHLSEIAKLDLGSQEEIVGVGGGEPGSVKESLESEIVTDKILTRKLHSNIRQIEDNIDIEKKITKDLLTQMERKRSLMAHTPSTWPARGWISSRYGWRNSPFTGRRDFHKGIDIAARRGTPIYAPADGVITSYRKNGAYGNFLVVNHGFGMVTRYGHLQNSTVQIGQQVKKGDRIALIGNTGRSTGPHVHYEVMVNGIHVNPQRYMLK